MEVVRSQPAYVDMVNAHPEGPDPEAPVPSKYTSRTCRKPPCSDEGGWAGGPREVPVPCRSAGTAALSKGWAVQRAERWEPSAKRR